MIEWYRQALSNRQNPATCIAFTKAFLSARPSERSEVVESWDPQLRWALPNPWRLACADEVPGSPIDRIKTDLLFQGFEFSNVDLRESIMGLAVVHNSCLLAGIDAKPVFNEVACAIGGSAAQAIIDFSNRDPQDQSMEAFMLSAIANPGGGYEIKADW